MKFELPTLYKTGNRGLEEWTVRVDKYDTFSNIVVTWGMSQGKMQEKVTSILEGKNLNKANSTTFHEQAISEAKSKWNKQIDKGYFGHKDEAIIQTKVLPMLAKVYSKEKNKVKFPCYINPKLDGIRGLAMTSGLYSRKGKKINTVPHIEEEIIKLFGCNSQLVLDGELYVHGDNFQKIISAAKRDEPNEQSAKLQYHIYDSFLVDETQRDKRNFEERTRILRDIEDTEYIKIVQTYTCNSEEDIFSFHSQFLSHGYEGSIVRLNNYPYEIDRRSFSLLKLKEHFDNEFKIVGYKEDKNKHCVFSCEMPNNKEIFDVKPEGSDEIRRKYLLDAPTLIGKMLTVRYFELTTSNNPVPRFPVGVIVRDYE